MNIVFDLGGVVFDWQPDNIICHVFDDPQTQELVRAEIFRHADWVELDRGTLSLEKAVLRGTARTGLPREDVQRLLDAVPHFLIPIEETIELIRSIRNLENRLLVLSNMHLASISHLEKTHDIWDLFDGTVISSRIRMVKPETEIYEYLLSNFQLDAAETVFIDDTSENLEAASRLGIQTIQFVNAEQCRRDLAHLGFIQ